MAAPLMISISGIRGVVGTSLTPDSVSRLAASFGHHTTPGPILLADDGRTSGPMFRAACLAGLLSVGRDVVDLGLCPTPTTEYAVLKRNAAGAIIVTASHNPLPWNGIKFLGADGMFIRAGLLDKVTSSWDEGVPQVPAENVKRPTVWHDAAREHVEGVLNLSVINPGRIRKRKFLVAVDTICGSMGRVMPKLLERLGCRTVLINDMPSGFFPRPPEPVGANLTELAEIVRTRGADLGLALDPDGDRLALVANGGRLISEEYTLALAVKHVRAQQPGGPVVINLSTSRMIEDLGISMGFDVFRSPVGEINVADEMALRNADLGGEGNGGVMLKELHVGRDGLVSTAIILNLLAACNSTLTQEVDSLPSYAIHKRKLSHPQLDRSAVMEAAAGAFPDGEMDSTDGVRVAWDDRWVQIRASNTEPIVRVFSEAPTQADADALAQRATDFLSSTTGLPLKVE